MRANDVDGCAVGKVYVMDRTPKHDRVPKCRGALVAEAVAEQGED